MKHHGSLETYLYINFITVGEKTPETHSKKLFSVIITYMPEVQHGHL